MKVINTLLKLVKDWHPKYLTECLIGILGFVLLNLMFIGEFFRGEQYNRTSAGQLGDFVGGYAGTAFTLISVLLLYATLKNQRISNEISSFELKFFELLNLHRANVSEMQLQGAVGRRIFVLLIVELRAIRATVLAAAKEVQLSKTDVVGDEQVWHIAYYFLYFGVGGHSSPMVKKALERYPSALIDKIDERLSDMSYRTSIKKDLKDIYLPFEGHQSRLGHYYRHLYQTATYVDEQEIAIDKPKYVKTLRAQLSTHEQALFLINSLTPVGDAWWNRNLITRYNLVKNVPLDFFDPASELDIRDYFPENSLEWSSKTLSSRKISALRLSASE